VRGALKSKVVSKGVISLTCLPTIEFSSSKLMSTLPSAWTLSDSALFNAAFASARSILETEPVLNLSDTASY
jgi:hypothetical protein